MGGCKGREWLHRDRKINGIKMNDVKVTKK